MGRARRTEQVFVPKKRHARVRQPTARPPNRPPTSKPLFDRIALQLGSRARTRRPDPRGERHPDRPLRCSRTATGRLTRARSWRLIAPWPRSTTPISHHARMTTSARTPPSGWPRSTPPTRNSAPAWRPPTHGLTIGISLRRGPCRCDHQRGGASCRSGDWSTVVTDDQHGDTVGWPRVRATGSTRNSADSSSRLPVGSSASSTAGSFASLRRAPPVRAPLPRAAAADGSPAHPDPDVRAARGPLHAFRPGRRVENIANSTFWDAPSGGDQVVELEHDAHVVTPEVAEAHLGVPARRTPSTSIVPPSGASSAPSRWSSVDFPAPEAPASATIRRAHREGDAVEHDVGTEAFDKPARPR